MSAPKLRFKEFAGNWPSVPLKDFVSFRKGKGISKADIQEDGIFQCIRYGELYTTYGQVITTIKSRTNISPSESILSQNGDVIIPASGETQIDIATASCVAKENVILGGDLNILSHQESGEWLAYYLSSAKKLEIAQLAQGNSVVHLYSSQLKELKVNKPTKAEQTKIASFLSAVDEKINQLTQKHQLLSQYKQGMMQKLFSQQIRFKADDGSEFGEWKSVFLGDISKPQQWKTISSSELTEIGYPVFGANGYIGFYPKYNHINETIAVTCRGATCGEVTLVKAKSYITGNAMSIDEINENEHSTLYIYYALCFRGFKDVISGSAQPQIVGNAIRKVTFQIPCLEEQTKIANFLSTIDQKIEVVAQQIEQAKMWKKGLLQQMFV